jgi:hypothetical protein
MIHRTDYAAVNGRGTMIQTFDTFERAKKWVKDRRCEHDGLHVIEITTMSRPVYRPARRSVAPVMQSEVA